MPGIFGRDLVIDGGCCGKRPFGAAERRKIEERAAEGAPEAAVEFIEQAVDFATQALERPPRLWHRGWRFLGLHGHLAGGFSHGTSSNAGWNLTLLARAILMCIKDLSSPVGTNAAVGGVPSTSMRGIAGRRADDLKFCLKKGIHASGRRGGRAHVGRKEKPC
jgi:hypothetical protein